MTSLLFQHLKVLELAGLISRGRRADAAVSFGDIPAEGHRTMGQRISRSLGTEFRSTRDVSAVNPTTAKERKKNALK